MLTKVVITMMTSMLSIIAITNRPLPPRLCSFAPCGNFGKCEEHDGTFSCHCFKVTFFFCLCSNCLTYNSLAVCNTLVVCYTLAVDDILTVRNTLAVCNTLENLQWRCVTHWRCVIHQPPNHNTPRVLWWAPIHQH